MKATTTQIFAKEGHKTLAIVALALIASMVFGGSFFVKLLLVGFFVFLLFFFKNPERLLESYDDEAITAPVDGKVIFVDRASNSPHFGGNCVAVGILTRLQDGHFLRSPVDGALEQSFTVHGNFLSVKSEKADHLNEKFLAFFKKADAKKAVLAIYAGVIPCRAKIYKSSGKVRLGDRFGFLAAESKTVIYLPQQSVLKVEVGQRVRAGESVIASFV